MPRKWLGTFYRTRVPEPASFQDSVLTCLPPLAGVSPGGGQLAALPLAAVPLKMGVMRVQPGATLPLSVPHLTALLRGTRLPQGVPTRPASTAPGHWALSYTVTSTRSTCSLPLARAGDTGDTSAVIDGPSTPACPPLAEEGHISSHAHVLCSCCEIWPFGCSPLSPIFWARRCGWYLTFQRGRAVEEPEIHHSTALSRQDRTRLDVRINLSLWVQGPLQMADGQSSPLERDRLLHRRKNVSL